MLPDIRPPPKPQRKDVPLDEVIELQNRGMTPQQISNTLSQKYPKDQVEDAISQATIKSQISQPKPSLKIDDTGIPPSTQPSPNILPPGNAPNIPPELMNAPAPSKPAPKPTQPTQETIPPLTPQIQPKLQTPALQPSIAPEPASRPSYEMIEEIAESVVKEKWNELIKNVGDIKAWKEKMQVDIKAIKQEMLRMQDRFEMLQKSLMGKLADYDEGVKEVGTEMRALEQVLQKILGPLTKNIKELEKVVQELKKKKK
jgi:hypothetical protein